MRKYLPLLLFIGFAWGQDAPMEESESDTLSLKDGKKYFGKFGYLASNIGFKQEKPGLLDNVLPASGKKNYVYFKPKGSSSLIPFKISKVQYLKLKDGVKVIDDGIRILTIKEKAIYDAKRERMKKFGGLLIGLGGLFITSTYEDFSDVEFDDLEKKVDSQRVRGQVGGVLIAIGGLFLINS